MPIKQLLIQPFQTLFIRMSKAKTQAPQFPTSDKSRWSVIVLVAMDGKSSMDDIQRLAVLARKVFGSVKILIFNPKEVTATISDGDILPFTRRDFTITGKLSHQLYHRLNDKSADLLIGLSANPHPLYRHLINQLPANFKAGITLDADVSGYHVVLRVKAAENNFQTNFQQLMDYLTNLKIKT